MYLKFLGDYKDLWVIDFMKHHIAIGEASKILGVCVKTLRRWDKDGKIHCYRTPGGHRRFAIIEIERIIPGCLTEELECFGGSESLYSSKTAICFLRKVFA